MATPYRALALDLPFSALQEPQVAALRELTDLPALAPHRFDQVGKGTMVDGGMRRSTDAEPRPAGEQHSEEPKYRYGQRNARSTSGEPKRSEPCR